MRGGIVAEKKLKKDASHVLLGERERTLASAIRRRVSSIHFLDRAFEEAGCSCTPYRDHLKELETQYQIERERLLQELDDSKLAQDMSDLRISIANIDLREHSSLDRDARQAHPFLAVWVLDQVREGKSEILGLSDREIGGCYAEAWYGGWRPKSLYRAKDQEA